MKTPTGKELGEKLLASVKQMKGATPARATKVELTAATQARVKWSVASQVHQLDGRVEAHAAGLGTR